METPSPTQADVVVERQLEPCPFCGGEATTHFHQLEETVSVTCNGCSAQMPYVGLDEEEAIAAWNRRDYLASPPAGGLREETAFSISKRRHEEKMAALSAPPPSPEGDVSLIIQQLRQMGEGETVSTVVDRAWCRHAAERIAALGKVSREGEG